MQKLSVFVTTFNNAQTLAACLGSVDFADEVVVLDSFSTDATADIAAAHGVEFFQHTFSGYGRQKQLALEHTRFDWVLFLDADEMVSPELAASLREMKCGDRLGLNGASGYAMPRIEQVFWRMSAGATRKNRYVRLFRRAAARFTEMPVHATVNVTGTVVNLRLPIFHFGETDIHTKVAKINGYSSGLVADKLSKGRRANPWIMVVYPPLFFVRSYFFKRGCTNGWAGFIASVVGSFYVFLKYAKLYEHACFERYGDRLMPAGAPAVRAPMERFDGPT